MDERKGSWFTRSSIYRGATLDIRSHTLNHTKKFYNLENGIHTMNMPLTGQYEFVLSGWGQGNSAGCKVTMIKSFKQGETIKFFIGSFLGGVFVFDKAYQLIAVAGSAGQSQEEKIRCSGLVATSINSIANILYPNIYYIVYIMYI